MKKSSDFITNSIENSNKYEHLNGSFSKTAWSIELVQVLKDVSYLNTTFLFMCANSFISSIVFRRNWKYYQNEDDHFYKKARRTVFQIVIFEAKNNFHAQNKVIFLSKHIKCILKCILLKNVKKNYFNV